MARRRKGKKGKRRTKTVPIGATLGSGIAALNLYNSQKDIPDMNNKIAALMTNVSGFHPTEGTSSTLRARAWNTTWKPMLAGVVVSTVLPKIPIVKTLPKKIPFLGKYIRW